MKEELLRKYYNSSIQIHINVIHDILDECLRLKPKLLVFGLGYDSKLWYNATDGNTFFVEHTQEYID